MPQRPTLRVWLLCLLVLAFGAKVAGAQDVPKDLPRYDLDVRIDVENHFVHVWQRVTWTNRHKREAKELVFSVYPHFKLPGKDVGTTAKMLEILRMTPSDAIDFEGRACDIRQVVLCDADKK